MFGIIYLLTNTKNGKVYVGQTTLPLERRWKLHVSSANGRSQRIIHRAIRKYGCRAFQQQVLTETSTKKELDRLEIEYIAQFQARDNRYGYNCALGGNNPRVGTKHSEETKNRLRTAWQRKKQRGYVNPPSFTTAGLIPWNKGKNHSQETKVKMSKSANWSPERRAAQAERARKQALANPEHLRDAGLKGLASRWGG